MKSALPATLAHTVERLLVAGGDSRITVDPRTGRNRYGAAIRPMPDEISFASSTASSPSVRGFEAAALMLERVLGSADYSPAEAVRERLLALYGIPATRCILTPSGTDSALLASALAGAARRPALCIVAPASETGSGIGLASTGCRYDPAPPFVRHAGPDSAASHFASCRYEAPALRHKHGLPIARSEYEAQIADLILDAVAKREHVVLHLLDASKTGLAPLDRAAARRLCRLAPGSVTIVVDACQLRCSSAEIRSDLAEGWFVMITGSKFAGGPPFSGALLVPSAANIDLYDLRAVVDFSTIEDWPSEWRGYAGRLTATRNLGLLLRWQAALAEIERFERADLVAREECVTRFADAVRLRVAARPHLRLVAGGQPNRLDTIFTIETAGVWRAAAGAAELRNALAGSGPVRCNVGQPVAIGASAALRVCASMPMINEALSLVEEGVTLNRAIGPAVSQLDQLFATWDGIVLATRAKAS